MAKKKQKQPKPADRGEPTHKNRPLHIPLDFNKAVEGLLNVKPKKPKPDEPAKE